MAALTAPADTPLPRLRARHLFLKVREFTKSAAAAVITPHTASLRRLADMPLAVAGTGCIDFAAWHVDHGVGWLVTGISLWLVEHLVSDPDDGRPE